MMDKLEERLLLNIKFQIETEVQRNKLEPTIVGSNINSIDSAFELEPTPTNLDFSKQVEHNSNKSLVD